MNLTKSMKHPEGPLGKTREWNRQEHFRGNVGYRWLSLYSESSCQRTGWLPKAYGGTVVRYSGPSGSGNYSSLWEWVPQREREREKYLRERPAHAELLI